MRTSKPQRNCFKARNLGKVKKNKTKQRGKESEP
jgi:hypothetical protein